jgi:putative transposase
VLPPIFLVKTTGKDDNLVKIAPILDRYGDFATILGDSTHDEPEFKRLRQSETTGRPLGSEEWIEKLEIMTGKKLKPQKHGPKMHNRVSE